MTYFAKCHCGAVEVNCDCAPDPVIICHCKLCRRRTGSFFQVAAWFDSKSVLITGATEEFTRTTGDSGLPFTFNFCPACGTTIWWLTSNSKGSLSSKIAVAGGCFEQADAIKPTISIYGKHKESWLSLPVGIEKYEAGLNIESRSQK